MMLLKRILEQANIYMDAKEHKLAIKELKKGIKLIKNFSKRKGK